METPVFDSETNKPVGYVDIPQEVLEAARLVYNWLRKHRAVELHGLRLSDDLWS